MYTKRKQGIRKRGKRSIEVINIYRALLQFTGLYAAECRSLLIGGEDVEIIIVDDGSS